MYVGYNASRLCWRKIYLLWHLPYNSINDDCSNRYNLYLRGPCLVQPCSVAWVAGKSLFKWNFGLYVYFVILLFRRIVETHLSQAFERKLFAKKSKIYHCRKFANGMMCQNSLHSCTNVYVGIQSYIEVYFIVQPEQLMSEDILSAKIPFFHSILQVKGYSKFLAQHGPEIIRTFCS